MEPVVSAEHVRARWAYSELLSDRPYNDPSVQELKKKALEGVPFEDLNADEHGLLAQTWYRVRGVPTFIHGFAGITTFQLAFRPPPSDERAPPHASCAPQALG